MLAQPPRQPQLHAAASPDSELPMCIPFREEKQGKSTKVPGKSDSTRCKGKGVVKAATASSALSRMQYNTVRVEDAIQRLAVQGTVQPVGKGTTHH